MDELDQRQPRVRDSAYMSWIAGLPCVACMVEGRFTRGVHVCHIRFSDAAAGWVNPGMQQKPDDRKTWPGCPSHHVHGPKSQHHSGDEGQWWADLGVDPAALVEDLNAAYDTGKAGYAVIAKHAGKAKREKMKVTPVRIQLSRAKGFRLQEVSMALNGLPAVKVDRTTRWGNPWTAAAFDDPAAEYRASIGGRLVPSAGDIIHHLRGKNIACWCALPVSGEADRCHGAVLLDIANREPFA